MNHSLTESKKKVYLIFVELGANSGPFLAQGLAGGFCTTAIATEDIIDAINCTKRALTDDEYDIVEIEKVMKFEPEEWVGANEIIGLVAEARMTDEVVYSEFEVWGH